MAKSMMSIRRTFELLELLADKPEGMGFNNIQEKMGNVPAPTLSRLLKALEDEKIVDKKNSKYILGKRFSSLARSASDILSRDERIQKSLDRLAMRTEQSAALFETHPDGCRIAFTSERPESFRYGNPGHIQRDYLRHSFGKVVIAYTDPSEIHDWWAKAAHEPPTSMEDFVHELQDIRKYGYYADLDTRNASVTRVVAPVFKDEELAGSAGISIIGGGIPEDIMDSYIKEVLKTAGEIEKILS